MVSQTEPDGGDVSGDSQEVQLWRPILTALSRGTGRHSMST